MVGDDYIRIALREIRQTYHSAVSEWASGNMLGLVKCLLDCNKKTFDLIKKIGEKND